MEYAAPEILLEHEYIATKSDMWSVGIVLYVCLYGYCPFKGKDKRDLLKSIDNGLVKDDKEEFSFSCRETFEKLLIFDFNKRLNSKNAKNEEFYQKYNGMTINDVIEKMDEQTERYLNENRYKYTKWKNANAQLKTKQKFTYNKNSHENAKNEKSNSNVYQKTVLSKIEEGTNSINDSKIQIIRSTSLSSNSLNNFDDNFSIKSSRTNSEKHGKEIEDAEIDNFLLLIRNLIAQKVIKTEMFTNQLKEIFTINQSRQAKRLMKLKSERKENMKKNRLIFKQKTYL